MVHQTQTITLWIDILMIKQTHIKKVKVIIIQTNDYMYLYLWKSIIKYKTNITFL